MPCSSPVTLVQNAAWEKSTGQKEPATLISIVGQAPLKATIFEMERLRCNACGQVFTAAEPETAGPDKYDATAVAMIALLKYGTGVP
jgi:transposase